MMKSVLAVLGLSLCFSVAAAERVLIVVSSAGTAENPDTGYEFDELTQAYWTFVDNGYSVEIASPAGGEPTPESTNPLWVHNSRFLEDDAAMHAASNTTPLANVSAEDYASVFLIGGTGASIDLPENDDLQTLIAEIYTDGGVIGAVCHGPAALVNVSIDGKHILDGRTLTAFTNREESMFGDKEGKYWSLEDRIVTEGGHFDGARPLELHVVTDGRIVTGQNPFSTAMTAEATIRAMGGTPKARELYRNEKTMNLAMMAMDEGIERASTKLKANPQAYEAMFLALLGYYQYQVAEEDAAVRDALTLMTLSKPYFDHEMIDQTIASAQSRLVGEK